MIHPSLSLCLLFLSILAPFAPFPLSLSREVARDEEYKERETETEKRKRKIEKRGRGEKRREKGREKGKKGGGREKDISRKFMFHI